MAGTTIRTAGGDLQQKVVQAYQDHVDYKRAAGLRMWLAFIVTFILLRGLTYGIRYHLLPVRNVVLSGSLRIHHFVWGIAILLVVGFLALILDQPRWHPPLAIAFGIGAALVIDEFALWLNLRDVYWSQKEGRASIDVAILVAALLGLYYAADRFWKQVVRDTHWALKALAGGERRRGRSA